MYVCFVYLYLIKLLFIWFNLICLSVEEGDCEARFQKFGEYVLLSCKVLNFFFEDFASKEKSSVEFGLI